MRISYWSSDVCSSDLIASSNASYRAKFRIWVVPPVAYRAPYRCHRTACARPRRLDCSRSVIRDPPVVHGLRTPPGRRAPADNRSEEHTSELQSLMRISYAVFCLNKKKQQKTTEQKIE